MTFNTLVQQTFQAVLNAFLFTGQNFLHLHFSRHLELSTGTLFTFLKGASRASEMGKESISVETFFLQKKYKFCGENTHHELKELVGIGYRFGPRKALCDRRGV